MHRSIDQYTGRKGMGIVFKVKGYPVGNILGNEKDTIRTVKKVTAWGVGKPFSEVFSVKVKRSANTLGVHGSLGAVAIVTKLKPNYADQSKFVVWCKRNRLRCFYVVFLSLKDAVRFGKDWATSLDLERFVLDNIDKHRFRSWEQGSRKPEYLGFELLEYGYIGEYTKALSTVHLESIIYDISTAYPKPTPIFLKPEDSYNDIDKAKVVQKITPQEKKTLNLRKRREYARKSYYRRVFRQKGLPIPEDLKPLRKSSSLPDRNKFNLSEDTLESVSSLKDKLIVLTHLDYVKWVDVHWQIDPREQGFEMCPLCGDYFRTGVKGHPCEFKAPYSNHKMPADVIDYES